MQKPLKGMEVALAEKAEQIRIQRNTNSGDPWGKVRTLPSQVSETICDWPSYASISQY